MTIESSVAEEARWLLLLPVVMTVTTIVKLKDQPLGLKGK